MIIKEVSEMYGLSRETLRYYESVGIIPSVIQEIESQEQLSVGKCLWQSTNIDRRTQQWKIVEKYM